MEDNQFLFSLIAMCVAIGIVVFRIVQTRKRMHRKGETFTEALKRSGPFGSGDSKEDKKDEQNSK